MSPSLTQLLIVFAIVVLIFGTKKLRNIGTDLGGAIKGFKKGLNEDEQKAEDDKLESASQEKVIEGETEKADQDKVR